MFSLDRLDDICEQIADYETLPSGDPFNQLSDNTNSSFYFKINLETGDMSIEYR